MRRVRILDARFERGNFRRLLGNRRRAAKGPTEQPIRDLAGMTAERVSRRKAPSHQILISRARDHLGSDHFLHHVLRPRRRFYPNGAQRGCPDTNVPVSSSCLVCYNSWASGTGSASPAGAKTDGNNTLAHFPTSTSRQMNPHPPPSSLTASISSLLPFFKGR